MFVTGIKKPGPSAQNIPENLKNILGAGEWCEPKGIAPHRGKELENMNFTKMREYSLKKKLNAQETFYY